MILYHAITTYHLLFFIVHKLIYAKNEEAIIIYPQTLYDKYPQLETSLNFVFNGTHQIYNSSRSEVLSITNLPGFEKIICDIKSFSDIYIAGAQNAFAFWLVENEIPFIFVEEACGRLSRPEVIMKNDQAIDEVRFSKALKYGLYTGENELIKKVLCNVSAQQEGWDNSKKQDFDLFYEMSKLSNQEKTAIMQFFNAPMIEGEQGTIVLTQHFANLLMMTYEDQLNIYKSIVSFFLEGTNIVFKLHPDDLADYEKVIPRIHTIKSKYPSELLPMLVKDPLKWNIATISSTGINILANSFNTMISFGTAYEKNFIDNSIIYFILKILTRGCLYAKVIVEEGYYLQSTHLRNTIPDCNLIIQDIQKSEIKPDNLTVYFSITKQEFYTDIVSLIKYGGTYICKDDDPALYQILHHFKQEVHIIVKQINYLEMSKWHKQNVFFVTKDLERAQFIMENNIKFEKPDYDISIYSGVLSNDEYATAILEGQLKSAESVIKNLEKELCKLKEEIGTLRVHGDKHAK